MVTIAYLDKTETINNSSPLKEEDFTWSEEDIKELQFALLNTALEELKDGRKSIKMRQEAWDWLMEDETSSVSEFSASYCCSANGISIEKLRSMLISLLNTGVIKL